MPSFAAFVTSRSSLDTPDIPKRPDFLLSRSLICDGVSFSFSARNVTTEGSSVPVRVPIINPSRGVSPMLVSMTLPPSTAAMEEPLPKWQVMIFSF